MSVETNQTSPTGPVAVTRYLLPREGQIALTRRHPAILIGPAALAVAGLLAAAILSSTVLAGNDLVWVLWVIWVGLVLNLIWKIWNWSLDYFVVTTERIILASGVLTRDIAMMPLTKVTDMSFQRTAGGRIFGYGNFIIESAGRDQALRVVDHIPYPEQLYLLVCSMLFPDSAEDEEEPGGGEGPYPDDWRPSEDDIEPPDGSEGGRRSRRPVPDEL